MTKKEFYELPIGTIVFNNETEQVGKFTSGFINEKEEKENDFRSIEDLFKAGEVTFGFIKKSYIDLKDCGQWEVYKSIEQVQNVNLKYKILQREIELLRHIVHKHLRVDSQFTNLI